MTPSPEDVDALFDAPAPPAPVVPPNNPLLGPRSAEGRREQRVKVSWPARVQLSNGKVVELRVRDLSDGGVGLLTDVHIPPSTVLNFAMGVQGRDLVCGGMWVTLPSDSRELLDNWIRRLRK
jgi:hypothetical protein